MRSLKELRELRASLIEGMQAIDKKADEEKRELKPDEQKAWDEKDAELRALEADIVRAEKREQLKADDAGRIISKRNAEKETERVQKYSFLKALRMAMDGKLDGVEDGFYNEMHQEAEKEARAAGLGDGLTGYGIPEMVLREKRDLTATGQTSVAGDQGGVLVRSQQLGFIDYLKDYLVLEQLGAQVFTGLKDNLVLPKGKTIATANWEGEVADADDTSPTFESITGAPKRLSAVTQLSKQLVYQSSMDIEKYVMNLLAYAVANKLHATAINGDGQNGVPYGVLNIPGIGAVVIGATGGAPTLNTIVELESKVDVENALFGKTGYLMNGKTKAKLKTTKIDAGSGLMLLGQDATVLNSYPYAVTNLVPSNLTKSTGSDLSALLFGNWADLILANWGGLDITVDKTSTAIARLGKVGIVINSFWDIIIRNPKSFAACKDVNTSLV